MNETTQPGPLEVSLSDQLGNRRWKMLHYTTHQGQLHHFVLWPDLEEQVTDDSSYFVATGPRSFKDGEIVGVTRHKPGVARVVLKHGNNCRLVYSRDEFLPAGVEVA